MAKVHTPAEFWRFVNALKNSAVVAAVESFSTRVPASLALARLFQAVGSELSFFLRSQQVCHFFTNPNLKELHLIGCDPDVVRNEYSRIECEFQYYHRDDNPLRWVLFGALSDVQGEPRVSGGELVSISTLPQSLLHALAHRSSGRLPAWVAVAPFVKGNTPFGYYAFCWYDEISPALFQYNLEGARVLEAAIVILSYVNDIVNRLVCNHYPIHRDTYIPAFQRIGFQPVCVLFADVRNFTTAFESGRLRMEGGDAYARLLVGFLKAYLEAASIAIAQPGIGRIDKFIGDGIMATFGEYLVCKATERPLLACVLGLYASAVLQSGFELLRERLFNNRVMKSFLSEYNDVLDIRLGVGVNYGEVMFEYFGSSSPRDNLIGGYSEYTAVGDQVNTAQRLEGLANKPLATVSLLERGPGRAAVCKEYTAPIVLSRTVFRRLSGALARPRDGRNLEGEYRSSFSLKGKGSAVEAYEIKADEINGDRIIRILVDHKVNERILNSVRGAWNDKEESFGFSSETIDALAAKYLDGDQSCSAT